MAGIYPLRPDLRLVGYAFTLRYIPAREDLADELYDNTKNVQRLAVEAIGEGDVLVIDARNQADQGATLGNILGTRVKVRGAVGIVTDGALRDTPAFQESVRRMPPLRLWRTTRWRCRCPSAVAAWP